MPTPREILISFIADAQIQPPGQGYNDYEESQRWNAVASALDEYIETEVRRQILLLLKEKIDG